jgi:hypothetical protein
MTRGKQIIEEAKRIIAEAHERGNNDPMVDLAVTLSFALGARWADKNPHWISVEDKLPKDGQHTATINKAGFRAVRYYKGGKWFSSYGNEYKEDITHWLPLPQPPSSSEKPNNCEKGGNQ